MRLSLRRLLLGVTASLALLVLSGAGALVASTRYLHGIAETLGQSVECLRAVEELEAELLSHHHAAVLALLLNDEEHAHTRAHFETKLKTAIAQAQQHVVSERERTAMADFANRLQTYMDVHERVEHAGFPRERGLQMLGQSFDEAFSALERLVAVNQEQAVAARQHARIDRGASLAALISGLALIVIVALTLRLERTLVFRPLQNLRRSIREFARGDYRSRASAQGVRELGEIASTFNDMAAGLQRRQDDQLAFLAGVAHDLRNPISALSLAHQRSQHTCSPSGECREIIELFGRQVGRLDRMVGDLLDATRIHAGKLALQLARVDLQSVGRECLDLFRPTSDTHRFELRIESGEVPVRGDAGRLAQAVNNLVSNAVKYTPPGGTITVRVGQSGGRAYVAVEDTGKGIPPEERDRIFEPFHRVASTGPMVPGTGLGLSVTMRIARAHGGNIEVESTLGSGSRFTLWLPLELEERTAIETHEPEPART